MDVFIFTAFCIENPLTLMHLERPKLFTILAFLSAKGLSPNALRKAKFVYNFGFSKCKRVK